MVKAEEAQVGLLTTPTRVLQNLWEAFSNPTAFIGESGDGHPDVSRQYHLRFGAAEYVDVRMGGETIMGNPGSLMVSRHNEDWDARLSDLNQRTECLINQGRGHSRAVEDVPPVYHQVDLSGLCRRQGPFVIRQEVVPPPPPLHSLLRRQVEAKVGVGQQQDTDGWGRLGHWSSLE
jgi:hypothetical protein